MYIMIHRDRVAFAAAWTIAIACISLSLSCATSLSAAAAGPSSAQPANWRQNLFAWHDKIDYASPEKYLAAGPLTGLSPENRTRLEAAIPSDVREGKSWEVVAGIYAFMMDRGNFGSSAVGGSLIAMRTADRMFADHTLTGCHDWGVILTASLRALGIPAIYVDTASVPWAAAYASGKRDIPFEGHIFVEAWIDGRWVILNSTKPEVLAEYQHDNPLLGFKVYESNQYFVMFKGLDPIDYGIRGNDDIQAAMAAASKRIVAESVTLKPSLPPKPLAELIPADETGRGNGRLLVVGARIQVEHFTDRFGAPFLEKRLVGYLNVTPGDLVSFDTIVCLYDLSSPVVPGFLIERFPDLGRKNLEPGVYRFIDGATLGLLVVGRDNADLLTAVDKLGIDSLRR